MKRRGKAGDQRSLEGSAPTTSLCQRLLLVGAGLLATAGLLLGVEAALALLGVGDANRYADPFVGFETGSPLFVRKAEGGQDDHIFPGNRIISQPVPIPAEQELDAHFEHLLIYMGIVDDLPYQPYTSFGKTLKRLVRILHRPVHAVTETNLLGEVDRQIADDKPVTVGADIIHQLTLVVDFQLRLCPASAT